MKKMKKTALLLAALALLASLSLAACDGGKDDPAETQETAAYRVTDTGVGDIVDWNA